MSPYEINSTIKHLLSKNHLFMRAEMLKINKWKKIKYWAKFLFQNKACFNYYFLMPLWAFSAINSLDFIKSKPDLVGGLSLLFVIAGLAYFLIRGAMIASDGEFKDLLLLSKENKERYWLNLRKENLSLDSYRLLCENLSKEDLLILAKNKKSITYEDIGVDSRYIKEILNFEKNRKEEEYFISKNEKLTNFLEVMHNEINKK